MYWKATLLSLALLVTAGSALGQSKRNATQDLSHIYGEHYEEVLEKYGDDFDALARIAREVQIDRTFRRNPAQLFKSGQMATPWIIRDEVESNNTFDSADAIDDVLAVDGWRLDGDGTAEFKGGQVSATLTAGDFDIYRFTVDTQKMYYFASTHSFTDGGEDALSISARLFHASDVDTTMVEDFKGIAGNDQRRGDLLGRDTDGRNGSGDFRITGWSAYVDQATGNLVDGDYYLMVYNEAGQTGRYNLIAYAVDFAPLVTKFESNQTNLDVFANNLVSTLPDDAVVRTFMAHNVDTVKVQSPSVPSASNSVYDQLMARGDEDVDNYLVNYKAGHSIVLETMPYFGWYRTPEGEIGPGGSRLDDVRILLFDADYQTLLGDDDDGAREQMDGPNNIHSRLAFSSADMAAKGITEDSPIWFAVMAWASKTRVALSGGSAADIAGRGVDNSDPGRFVYNVYVHQYADDLLEANHEPNDSPATAMSIAARTDTVATGNTSAAGDVDYYRVFLHETRMYSVVVPANATVEIMHEYESDNATGATSMTGDLLASDGFRYNPAAKIDGASTILSGLVVENSGAYLIKVTGATAGNYTMAVVDKGQTYNGLIANEPDDTSSDALAQDRLEVGPGAASRTASIFPAGDVDHHHFSVSAGFELNLSLRPSSDLAADFEGAMTLLDPNGATVATGASTISHTAAGAGTYILRVEAASAGAVGFYTLSGGEPFTEKEPNNTFANATLIALGQLYEASLSAGDTDFYRFTLEAGKLYSFRSFDNETGGALTVEFFDDLNGQTLMDGSGWASNYSGGNFKIANIIPSETKTYYLKISGGAGAYKIGSRINADFEALSIAGEPNNTPADADAMGAYQAFGADVPFVLYNADHPRFFGDEDWFRVELAAGQTLTVEAKPVEGLGGVDNWNRDTDTKIVIFASDGVSELADDDDGGNDWYSRVAYPSASAQTVYVQVRTSRSTASADDRSMNRGDYVLNVSVLAPEVEPNNDIASADGNVLTPGVVDAAFDDTDQLDIFRLNLSADHIYHVRTFRPEGGYDAGFDVQLVKASNPTVNLLDGTGYTTRNSGSNLKLNIIPDATETYYLRIAGAGNGAYQVALKGRSITDLKSVGEPNNSITQADAIGAQSFEGPGETRLTMLYNADHPWTAGANPLSARYGDDLDYYRYDLAAGDTLVAETAPVDGPLWPRDFDAYMELYDAAGTLIQDNDDGAFDWHSRITYIAEQAETVYVLVRGQDYQGATDRDPSRGEYLYAARRLNSAATGTSTEDLDVPTTYRLMQNYPNPFNPTTTLQYELPASGDVRLTVYNVLGQVVRTLVNSQQTAGTHAVTFDASGLASGMYLYRLEAGNFVTSKMMLLVK